MSTTRLLGGQELRHHSRPVDSETAFSGGRGLGLAPIGRLAAVGSQTPVSGIQTLHRRLITIDSGTAPSSQPNLHRRSMSTGSKTSPSSQRRLRRLSMTIGSKTPLWGRLRLCPAAGGFSITIGGNTPLLGQH